MSSPFCEVLNEDEKFELFCAVFNSETRLRRACSTLQDGISNDRFSRMISTSDTSLPESVMLKPMQPPWWASYINSSDDVRVDGVDPEIQSDVGGYPFDLLAGAAPHVRTDILTQDVALLPTVGGWVASLRPESKFSHQHHQNHAFVKSEFSLSEIRAHDPDNNKDTKIFFARDSLVAPRTLIYLEADSDGTNFRLMEAEIKASTPVTPVTPSQLVAQKTAPGNTRQVRDFHGQGENMMVLFWEYDGADAKTKIYNFNSSSADNTLYNLKIVGDTDGYTLFLSVVGSHIVTSGSPATPARHYLFNTFNTDTKLAAIAIATLSSTDTTECTIVEYEDSKISIGEDIVLHKCSMAPDGTFICALPKRTSEVTAPSVDSSSSPPNIVNAAIGIEPWTTTHDSEKGIYLITLATGSEAKAKMDRKEGGRHFRDVCVAAPGFIVACQVSPDDKTPLPMRVSIDGGETFSDLGYPNFWMAVSITEGGLIASLDNRGRVVETPLSASVHGSAIVQKGPLYKLAMEYKGFGDLKAVKIGKSIPQAMLELERKPEEDYDLLASYRSDNPDLSGIYHLKLKDVVDTKATDRASGVAFPCFETRSPTRSWSTWIKYHLDKGRRLFLLGSGRVLSSDGAADSFAGLSGVEHSFYLYTVGVSDIYDDRKLLQFDPENEDMVEIKRIPDSGMSVAGHWYFVTPSGSFVCKYVAAQDDEGTFCIYRNQVYSPYLHRLRQDTGDSDPVRSAIVRHYVELMKNPFSSVSFDSQVRFLSGKKLVQDLGTDSLPLTKPASNHFLSLAPCLMQKHEFGDGILGEGVLARCPSQIRICTEGIDLQQSVVENSSTKVAFHSGCSTFGEHLDCDEDSSCPPGTICVGGICKHPCFEKDDCMLWDEEKLLESGYECYRGFCERKGTRSGALSQSGDSTVTDTVAPVSNPKTNQSDVSDDDVVSPTTILLVLLGLLTTFVVVFLVIRNRRIHTNRHGE